MKIKETTNVELKKRLVKSLLTGLVFAIAIIIAFKWASSGEKIDGISQPLRQSLDLNSKFGGAIYSDSNQSPPKTAPNRFPRTNGDIGLTSALDLENYRVSVESGVTKLSLKLDEIKSIPFSEAATDFKCIEGWTEVFHYSGVRFSDFMKKFNVGLHEDGTPYRFVGLETPDGEYYVSLDIKSIMHSQSILAFEMNGMPLRPQNGAPIRLIIPNKYGIKSLKRIGRIEFSDIRPPDYWHQRGYDWFAGL